MEKNKQQMFDAVNRAIIRTRGIYSEWSNNHRISYNEMLVLYTIRENGFCTQKQICDSYLLPKQTINHVIGLLRRKNFLVCDEAHSRGREKAFCLSATGEEYAAPFLKSLNRMEERALELFDEEGLKKLIELLTSYDMALDQALAETI